MIQIIIVFFFRRIGENLEHYIPNLESVILTNNNISELGDLDPLSTLPKLRTLSLMHNPVANKNHYRLVNVFYLTLLYPGHFAYFWAIAEAFGCFVAPVFCRNPQREKD